MNVLLLVFISPLKEKHFCVRRPIQMSHEKNKCLVYISKNFHPSSAPNIVFFIQIYIVFIFIFIFLKFWLPLKN